MGCPAAKERRTLVNSSWFRPLFSAFIGFPNALLAAVRPAGKSTPGTAARLGVELLEDRTLMDAGLPHLRPIDLPFLHRHPDPPPPAVVAPADPNPGPVQEPPSQQAPAAGSGDPLYVMDMNNDVVLPTSATPINSFSQCGMNLEAQVSGATVSNYSWDFSKAPDATGITGASSYNAAFSWASFTGAAHNDTITVTETSSGGAKLTQSYDFVVASTTSPAWTADPTSAATWPTVVTPDQVNGQAMVAAGPYASLGLADGSVQTSHSLPSYNPNVAPLTLVYNSAVADPQPVFQTRFQLDPTKALPSSLTAQLTLTNGSGQTVYTGPTVYYNPGAANPGDWLQIALPASAAGLASGRYNWQIQVTATYSGTPTTTTYTGAVSLITSGTAGNNLTANPFGPGWSLANVQRLIPTTSGVILQNPDGTSLWFANGTGGSFVTPAGDFSTLTYNSTTGVYTRTLTNGTQVNFNSSGQQTSIVDRDGNTTTFTWNTSNELASVTDMNGQVNNLTYNTSGQATAITDPANRTLALAFNGGGQLVTLTDPDNAAWNYGYDSANDLTTLSDPRANLNANPPTYTTFFTYGTAGKVSQVTQPDGSTLSLTAAGAQGLAAAGTGTSSNPAPVVLLGAAYANFTDGNGNTWTTYLDGLGFGQPVSAADPLGDTSLTYRNSNDLAWLTADPLGRRERFFFDAQGNTTQTVNADDTTGGTGMISYNNFAEPLTVKDETGAQTTYTYSSKGDLLQVENAGRALTTFAVNSAGLVTGMTDALGNHWTYTLDSLNRRTGETDPLSHTQAWAYDSAGDLTSYTNQDGFTATYSYDTMGRMTGETLPQSATLSSIYSFSYDAAGNQVSASVPLYYNGSTLVSATTTSAYDTMNRLTSSTDPVGAVTQYQFDKAGNLVGVVNPLGNTVTYSLDAADRLVGTTIPITNNGTLVTATTTYGLDAAGEVTSTTNALGQTTQNTYTSRGWLASSTDPLGNASEYSYDAVGDVTNLTLKPAQGSSIIYSYGYDGLHRHTTTSSPVVPMTNYTYNADNQLTSISGYNDGQGNVSFTYDALGRELTQSDALGDTSHTAYDPAGNVSQQTDALGNSVTYAYDRQNDLLSSTNALSGVTSYTYNLAGWQTSETDPAGNQTQYSLNAAGEMTAETNGLGYQQTFSYDLARELTGTTNYNGQVTDYSYNLAGWRTGESWLNSQNQVIYQATYTRDNAGELTGASDNNSAYGYSYNADGQVTQETVTYPGLSSQALVTLSFAYDGVGDRTNLSDSLGGKLSYSFNQNFQLTGLTLSQGSTAEAGLTFSYDSQDRLSTLSHYLPGQSFSFDMVSSYNYDAANRLLGLTYSNQRTQAVLASFTYTFNADSLVSSYTGPEGTSSYSYDKVNELTGVTGAQAANYSYDLNGNRSMTGYQTGSDNTLTSDGTFSYTYDHAGNMLTKTDSSGNVWTFTWDNRGRLAQVVETNSSQQVVMTEVLTYDVNNNLISVSVNGTVQRWTVYDGTHPYLDFTAAGQASQRYLTDPGSGTLFAKVSAQGTVSWYVTDAQGSVRQIVSSTGTVLDTISYDAYGNVLSESSPANGDRFKYAGGQYDSNLGLYLFGARWYSTGDGRWISQDPLGLGPDTNPYRYVYNGPTNGTDPLGLQGCGFATVGYDQALSILRAQARPAMWLWAATLSNSAMAQISASSHFRALPADLRFPAAGVALGQIDLSQVMAGSRPVQRAPQSAWSAAGAGGGLASGAITGAWVGSFGGPVGAIIGGTVGGLIGYFAGGSFSRPLTGQGSTGFEQGAGGFLIGIPGGVASGLLGAGVGRALPGGGASGASGTASRNAQIARIERLIEQTLQRQSLATEAAEAGNSAAARLFEAHASELGELVDQLVNQLPP
jgi:RHS repeat-associated protein